MNAVVTSTRPRTLRTTGIRDDGSAVTQSRVVRAEWIKLHTVRSRVVALVSAAVAAVGFGMLFSSFAARRALSGRPAEPLTLSLSGFGLAQLVVGVVGVIVATSEYSTGMIRATFSAVGRRSRVVWAKAIVVTVATQSLMTPAAVAAFFAGRFTYNGVGPLPSMADPGVLRAVIGSAIYVTGVAVIGVALGFLLRSTGAAIGVLFGALLVIPPLAGLLPGSFGEMVTKLLPSSAGQSFVSLTQDKSMLSPGVGFVTFIVWVVGLVATGAAVVGRHGLVS